MVRLQNEIPDAVRFQHDILDRLDRPVTAPVTVPENPISNDLVNSRPRSAPLPWTTAITDTVNALWNAMYDRRPVVASALERELPEVPKGPIPTCDRRETYVSPVNTVRPDPHVSTVPGRRLWRLDSDTEIDLDQRQTKKPSPELDLRIHPPLRRQSAIRFPTDPDATLHMAPIRDECRIPKVEEKNDRSVRVECRPRSSSRRTRKPNDHSYSRVRESSETRSKERSKKRSKSANLVSRHRESPPDDSSDSSDMEEDQHRDRDRGRNRPRRRGDPSPDGDASGDDSSTDGDETETRTVSKQFRIKLQKFDGTGSWESWWAHFQNCASYNKWTKRDKLAFIKGALTDSASQVLCDRPVYHRFPDEVSRRIKESLRWRTTG